MGNVGSKPDDGAAFYLRDQNRLSISSLVITCPKSRTSVHITPTSFPASRVTASRPLGDNIPVEFVQDPESLGPGASPGFLLKLSNDDELIFHFSFIIRQSPAGGPAVPDLPFTAIDTSISGLTFVHASTPKEVDNLVTREFFADPNLHKNSQVTLMGDYATDGSVSVTFDWSWKWPPPRGLEEKAAGWRNCCTFFEYDPRTHKLLALAGFSFWVSSTDILYLSSACAYMPVALQYTDPEAFQDVYNPASRPNSPSGTLSLPIPPRIRIGSVQSTDSRLTVGESDDPPSPLSITNESISTLVPAPPPNEAVRFDLACPKPGDDVSVTDDGPLFRATMKALEQKTGNMRIQMKRVLRRAETAHVAQMEANEALTGFVDALREASSTNANAVQPAIEHYFDKIAREILAYERQNTTNIQKMIIEPISRLYTIEIKQAENKKRDFEEESKDYYAYVARYLGQRQDSVKAKKLAESDSKYQTKRRNFELKRFDYSNFMQDLHGGRKEQEVLSQLTKYAKTQTEGFLETAKRIDIMLPQFNALFAEVQDADKEYQYQRLEREEKRRNLEKINGPFVESEPGQPGVFSSVMPSNGSQAHADGELGRADSTGSNLRLMLPSGFGNGISGGDPSRSPGNLAHPISLGSPAQGSKFKGFRDLDEKDPSGMASMDRQGAQRKEGLLWAFNRPSLHVDPRNLNKQGWHKYWIVLDQGKLAEYSNWKQKLDLHMEPIDLRLASVREARSAERRFCFEIITPNNKRVYQATSEEDMNSWIVAINNALQSAVEGRGFKERVDPIPSPTESSSFKRDIGSMFTGKAHSHNMLYTPHSSGIVGAPTRRITVGGRPNLVRAPSSYDESPDKLLQTVRETDHGNCWCADCGSGSKVEWVSINLGIVLCIECSGIHRSLGTHISKVRSLTLDIHSFTPDIVELLLVVGNRVSNMVWEAKLDLMLKPNARATREQRLKFITAKYVERAYIQPILAAASGGQHPDEMLLAAIKKNQIQQVLYALALKANPNATDRSRGTHAVFLALAAADPAPSSLPTNLGPQVESDAKPIPFPVAELLLQNGAELPASMPAIPLGRAAQQFVELRRGRGVAASLLQTPSFSSISGTSDRGGQRERESRLQKRLSAGGRLAKSPIPER